jgi:hypothetical protein
MHFISWKTDKFWGRSGKNKFVLTERSEITALHYSRYTHTLGSRLRHHRPVAHRSILCWGRRRSRLSFEKVWGAARGEPSRITFWRVPLYAFQHARALRVHAMPVADLPCTSQPADRTVVVGEEPDTEKLLSLELRTVITIAVLHGIGATCQTTTCVAAACQCPHVAWSLSACRRGTLGSHNREVDLEKKTRTRVALHGSEGMECVQKRFTLYCECIPRVVSI